MQLTATAKILRSNLSALNSSLSTADLVSSVSAAEAEKAEIEARLDSLKAGKAKKVTKEEREQVEKEWKRALHVAKKREWIRREMWNYIGDQGLDREQKDELWEMLGLDE